MGESLLFLTGHLAYANLCHQLEVLELPDHSVRVENIQVKVAALMTTNIISRRLKDVSGVDRVILPGLVAGDLHALSDQFGIPFEHGPKDLRDLPEYFGQKNKASDLSQHEVKIFAEIVDAPNLSINEIVQAARQYQRDGADVIDVGCLPEVAFPHLRETVTCLKQEGFLVSVDSLDVDDLVAGGEAGADYLLSLKESTLWVTDQVDSTPVIIPEQQHDMESLYRAMDIMLEKGKPFLADPILDPFPFGFTNSIVRYHTLCQRYPQCDILMGTGNVTELVDADTSGMTAILLSMMTELRIGALLTTQVSEHARRSISEADLARRLMFAAMHDGSLPKRYSAGLMTIHDKKPFPYSTEEIMELATAVKDKNYRIQVSEEGVHLYNREGHVMANDPFELMQHIEVEGDLSHMFYLGVELSKAQIAWQLGKRYLQDNDIDWGVAARVTTESE